MEEQVKDEVIEEKEKPDGKSKAKKVRLGKKWIICLSVLCALIAAFIIIFPTVYCVALKVDVSVQAVQVEDEQSVKVTWSTSKPVDKLSIGVYHNGRLVKEMTTANQGEINKGECNLDVFYGRFTVKAKAVRGIYKASAKNTVNVFTDEYNIAPITATMPVTIFTLSLSEITDNGRIPTFVWFKRSGAWDWSQLPENVHPMPVADAGEFFGSGEGTMYSKTTAYVKELYEINPNSKFHMFYNDYFAYGWVQATIANGIPAENYDVVLLSDGTASFQYFNKHFDNENAETEYAKMAGQWAKTKEQVAKKKSYNKSTSAEIKAEPLREYAYVMATEEPNVEWWLTRISGTLANNNEAFYQKVAANTSVKVKDLGGLLKNIQGETGENAYMTVQSLKKLYKFSDDMFEKATLANKKVMVILGTWTSTEKESHFDDYVLATKAFYGDEYEYYYKGHPRNPTNSELGKAEKLESLGLTDIDATIPAELIFFFNPEAFCSGFASTTFVSLTAEKSCAIFNSGMAEFTETYKDNIDIFMSKPMKQIGNLNFFINDYLIEFADKSIYDIAVFNSQKKTLVYYKEVKGGVYEEVKYEDVK